MNPQRLITAAERACESGPDRPWCHPPEPTRWPSHILDHLRNVTASGWPQVGPAVVVAVLAGGFLLMRAYRAERDVTRRARWVEVIPAAHAPKDGGRTLWQAFAGVLSIRSRRLGPGCGRRIAVEFVADPQGRLRAGVWVPPTSPLTDVRTAIAHGWPGAQTRITAPPPLRASPNRPPPRVRQLRPAGRDPWAPLLDPQHRREPVSSGAGGTDRLHGVLAALAERRPGHLGASVQLVVTSATGPGHGGSGGDGSVWARTLGWTACLPLRALVEVLALLVTGPKTAHHCGRPSRAQNSSAGRQAVAADPIAAVRRRTVIAKQGRRPHLRVTLRIAALPPGGERRRDPTAAIVLGYQTVPDETTLTVHRLLRGPHCLTRRTAGPGRGRFVVTVDEAAALWHLPDEPARYGLDAAPAHSREPAHQLSRITRADRGDRHAT